MINRSPRVREVWPGNRRALLVTGLDDVSVPAGCISFEMPTDKHDTNGRYSNSIELDDQKGFGLFRISPERYVTTGLDWSNASHYPHMVRNLQQAITAVRCAKANCSIRSGFAATNGQSVTPCD